MSPRPARSLALVLLFLVFWGLTTHGKYTDSGDEPHYLMMAQSLWADHDLDLANNYAQHDGAAFGAAGLQHELHALPARDGALRPAHDIGVAVALLPAYAVATTIASKMPEDVLHRFRMTRGLFAYALISLAVMAIVLFAAAATMTALAHVGADQTLAVWLVFVLWATMPLLANAYEVFPEPFALLVTAWAVREWTAPRAWTRRTWMLLAALGLLPWFHRKYVPYALALLVIVLWRKREALQQLAASTRVAAVAIATAPVGVLALWTFYYWGTIGGALTRGHAPFSWDAFAHGAPGLFIDRENGLFWWAPLSMMWPTAFALRRELRPWLLPIAALVIPSAAHDQWWAGFSPACRFLVPLVPILCLALADLFRYRVGRAVAYALLVPQLLIAAWGWQHPHDLWPRGDGRNRVLAAYVSRLGDTWLPSFRVPSTSTRTAAVTALFLIAALNVVVVRQGRRADG